MYQQRIMPIFLYTHLSKHLSVVISYDEQVGSGATFDTQKANQYFLNSVSAIQVTIHVVTFFFASPGVSDDEI